MFVRMSKNTWIKHKHNDLQSPAQRGPRLHFWPSVCSCTRPYSSILCEGRSCGSPNKTEEVRRPSLLGGSPPALERSTTWTETVNILCKLQTAAQNTLLQTCFFIIAMHWLAQILWWHYAFILMFVKRLWLQAYGTDFMVTLHDQYILADMLLF